MIGACPPVTAQLQLQYYTCTAAVEIQFAASRCAAAHHEQLSSAKHTFVRMLAMH